jgi:Bacterial Ig-like domain (group 2)
MRTVRLLSLALAAAASVAGCQSGASNPLGPEFPATSPLTVVPRQATVDGGQAIHLTASLKLPDGSRTTPDNVRWSSADTRIAQVDQSGTVHALQAGRVQIIAEWQDSRGSSSIVVADQVLKKGECPVFLEGGTGSSTPTSCF